MKHLKYFIAEEKHYLLDSLLAQEQIQRGFTNSMNMDGYLDLVYLNSKLTELSKFPIEII